MKPRSECHCVCHTQPGVKHVIACCDAFHILDANIQATIDALEKLPEVTAVSKSVPKQHSLPLSLPGEWLMCCKQPPMSGSYVTYVCLYKREFDYVVHNACWNDDCLVAEWQYHQGEYFQLADPKALEKASLAFKLRTTSQHCG